MSDPPKPFPVPSRRELTFGMTMLLLAGGFVVTRDQPSFRDHTPGLEMANTTLHDRPSLALKPKAGSDDFLPEKASDIGGGPERELAQVSIFGQ